MSVWPNKHVPQNKLQSPWKKRAHISHTGCSGGSRNTGLWQRFLMQDKPLDQFWDSWSDHNMFNPHMQLQEELWFIFHYHFLIVDTFSDGFIRVNIQIPRTIRGIPRNNRIVDLGRRGGSFPIWISISLSSISQKKMGRNSRCRALFAWDHPLFFPTNFALFFTLPGSAQITRLNSLPHR